MLPISLQKMTYYLKFDMCFLTVCQIINMANFLTNEKKLYINVMAKKKEQVNKDTKKNVENPEVEEIIEDVEKADDSECADTPEESDQVEQLSREEQLEKECAEYKDKYIRLAAEFDNFRRRTLKEKADLIKSGGESIILGMLPVIDDLDRAANAISTAQDVDSVKEGIDLILNKFQSFLKQNGVQEIDADSQEFDIDKHEAITKIPAPSEDLKGKVVDLVQKGYIMHDKVIRYAKVVIGE